MVSDKNTFKISDLFPWVKDNGYCYYFPKSYRYIYLDKQAISCTEIRNNKSDYSAFVNAAHAPDADSYLRFRAFEEGQASVIFTSVWCIQSKRGNAAKRLKFSQLVPEKSSFSTEKAKINPGPHDVFIYMTDFHSRVSEIEEEYDIIVDFHRMVQFLDASSHERRLQAKQ